MQDNMEKTRYKLSASILSADFAQLGQQIQIAQSSGIDWIHIDVMDGQFVPNISMGPFIVETCRRITNLPLDVHLMIEEPEKHIAAFAKAGATNITIHPENNPNVVRTLQEIGELGCKRGVAINPGTSCKMIEPLLDFVDLVLVLTVNPGFSGQSFMPQIMPKIECIKKLIAERDIPVKIQVDGGVTHENIKDLALRGAEVFVAATSIFRHPQGIEAGIQDLHRGLI
jgi:ribulose-phosphate 3-epimerase